ncbi:hypothetical protein HORIV_49590 [Vreelandella olivaria]|uniref:Uncharacterized protein n=1 Tax=Vreelandella olivaria TaxID=390919 RepID=A0ABM7GPB4_9GAMM|nr:hypothetical protein HORIV_49590 [Halomonas olivaria]
MLLLFFRGFAFLVSINTSSVPVELGGATASVNGLQIHDIKRHLWIDVGIVIDIITLKAK